MASTSTSGSKGKEKLMDAFGGLAPAAPTSASKLLRRPSYDVFINHRGPDVKSTLASVLYGILTGMQLSVFLDSEELESGDFFPRTLAAAMNTALLCIAIFSESYAQSPWCLAELAFIVKSGATIIPIFYYVDPSDLRWVDQRKGVYAKAFEEYEQKGRYLEHLQDWKETLHAVSFYTGEVIKNKDDEDRVLKNIVNIVVKKIKNVSLEVAKHPVGLEEIVRDFEMNRMQSVEGDQDVQIIGIWGMGGSGKTTLAKELYNQRSLSFEWSSFVFDVRDASTKGLLYKKQEEMLRDLSFPTGEFYNVEDGKRILSRHLRSVKVLIVLDDVDHVDQLDALLIVKDKFERGSLIIVTTREYDVLKSWDITSIYKMKALAPLYAKQLFCWHAFIQAFPKDGFEELVEKFLEACHGLPLSLMVVGAQLYTKSRKEYWESLLHKIMRISPIDIQKILKISYDALDDEEKEMFLDVACFFIEEEYTLPIEIWNGLGQSGLHTWERLLNKCLVEYDDYNYIRMHDHIRDLGRDIARKQSPYRFWLHQPDIILHQKAVHSGGNSFWGLAASICPCLMSVITSAFHNKTQNRIGIHGIIATPHRLGGITYQGTQTTRPIMDRRTGEVDFCNWCSNRELKVKTNRGIWSFSPSLVGLKYLVISGDSFNQVMGELSRELVWLRWFEIGQRNFPSALSLQKLKVLELYEDQWGGEHHLEELWGENDSEVPVQLSELIISNCLKFRGFPKSIGHLKYLKKMVIVSYNNVTSLPDEFCFLQSLEHLVLDWCKMQSLPSNFGNLSNLRYLSFYHCAELRSLPVSFRNLTLLEYLNLNKCSQLTFKPDDLNILLSITKLEFFFLSGCRKLEELPRHIGNNVFLRELDFSQTSLRELPDNIGQLSRLGWMMIENVLSTSLPTSLGGLSSLTKLYIDGCPNLERLPDSLGGLCSLKFLSIQSCPVLECVPDTIGDLSSLTELVIEICPNLERLPKAITQLSNLLKVNINRCPIRGSSLSFGSSNLKDIRVGETEVSKISFSEDCCTDLERLEVYNNHYLEEIEALPRTLQSISLRNCEMLKNIPSFAQLSSLREFFVNGCSRIEKMEGIPRKLESMSLGNCEMLKSIPSFAQSISLISFVLYGCRKIQKIEGIEKCTGLTELSVDTCWEVPGIEGLEHLQNLHQLELRANKGSVIEHCIQTIQIWPDEMRISACAVPEAASLVDSLLSPNLVIDDSISNHKIKSRPKLEKNGPSNGDAFMLCLVTNCLSSQKKLYIHNPWDRPFSIKLEKDRWVWVGVFTERSERDFLRAQELCIYLYGECDEEDEVEKGLLVTGEEQALMEALRSLWPLFQS